MIIVITFLVGYLLITLEHPLRVNKTATAIITGVLCWVLFMFSSPDKTLTSSAAFQAFTSEIKNEAAATGKILNNGDIFHAFVNHELVRHLAGIAEILFFLMGAMTIVELIDAHHGFQVITEKITTKNPVRLLWIVSWTTFFLSAILDNLTATIVMVSLIRKLVPDKETRLMFIGMTVIASNAGGSWTPLGDVTTTMLWIGGQISTLAIMRSLFIPAVICLLAPLIIVSVFHRAKPGSPLAPHQVKLHAEMVNGGNLMLLLGITILLGVPAFKVVTHLPPYLGMLLGLGIVWVVSELIHPELDQAVRKNYTVAGALSRIDVPSILFFLGILMAVGALESMDFLRQLSEQVMDAASNLTIVVTLMGLLSAIVDNVPLVAASIAMYPLSEFPTDHFLWQYLAYCTGTGGSILIIGSAAGVAAMGMEKIDFLWYLKKISWLALIGYLAGAGIYLLIF